MALYLGIDGGGTGCRVALADAAGRVLARAEAGPANIATNPEGAFAQVMQASRAALAQAGLAEASLAGAVAVLGLAGGNLSAAAREFAARLPFGRTRVLCDALTAAAGALRGGEGIVAALGTGSVYVRARGGVLHQIGGHGFRLGDWGGGAVLGRTLLAEALRAADGLRPATPLLAEVLADLGGVEGVIAFGLRAAPVDYARLAPRIVAADDPAAAQIFAAAVEEVAATLAHLQEGGAALPVVFLGGLGPSYAARLADRFEIIPALGSGLEGALWLARQEVA